MKLADTRGPVCRDETKKSFSSRRLAHIERTPPTIGDGVGAVEMHTTRAHDAKPREVVVRDARVV